MAFWSYLVLGLAVPAIAIPQASETPASAVSPPTSAKPTAADRTASDTPPDDLVEGKSDYYNRMTVPVTIEGEGPFRFMIDTGAQATVVTRGLTEKLNLTPNGSAIVVGMASRKPVQLVELNGLGFAERILDNISAPMLEARNIGADGILGLDSLQDLRVLINFREDTIAVNDANVLGGNRGYEIVVRARRKLGRLIIARARIDGVRTAVIIDTGAQSSFGNYALRKRLRSRNNQEVSTTDVNGVTVTGNIHIARKLQIQNLELSNVGITFATSPAFKALELEGEPALILGMKDLRLFDRVAIDFASRKVLFDVPAGAKTYDPLDPSFSSSRL